MAEADAANLEYTQCLFAASREASAAQLSVGAFEQKLARACAREQQALEDTAGRVLTSRGDRHGATRAHDLAVQARQQVIDAYRNALELEPLLKQ